MELLLHLPCELVVQWVMEVLVQPGLQGMSPRKRRLPPWLAFIVYGGTGEPAQFRADAVSRWRAGRPRRVSAPCGHRR